MIDRFLVIQDSGATLFSFDLEEIGLNQVTNKKFNPHLLSGFLIALDMFTKENQGETINVLILNDTMYIFDRIYNLIFVLISREPNSQKILKNVLKELKLRFKESFPNPNFEFTGDVSQFKDFKKQFMEIVERKGILKLNRILHSNQDFPNSIRIKLVDDENYDLLYHYPMEIIDEYTFGYQIKQIIQAINNVLGTIFLDECMELISLSFDDYAISFNLSSESILLLETKITCREDLEHLGINSKTIYDTVSTFKKSENELQKKILIADKIGNLNNSDLKPKVSYLFEQNTSMCALQQVFDNLYRIYGFEPLKSLILIGRLNIYIILCKQFYYSIYTMKKEKVQNLQHVISEGYHFLIKNGICS